MSVNGFNGLDPCVHCGFCLQSCPTYLATGDEADGPRGRIVLMQALQHNRIPAHDAELTIHLDRCLGCRACEPACPSGVQYGSALEEARRWLADSRPVPLLARIVNGVMAQPALRIPVLRSARAVRRVAGAWAGKSRLGFAMGMLAATKRWGEKGEAGEWGRNILLGTLPSPQFPPAVPAPVATLFTGCIMDGLFPHVHAATERTLQANGFRLRPVPGQMCCGALQAHTGQHGAALRLARANVAAFAAEPDSLIAVNSAGCGAILKEYGRLLAGDPLEPEAVTLADRVRDVSELLADHGPRAGARIQLRVAYDPPCHLLHAQGIADPPLKVLDAVPGLEHAVHAEAEHCCGSAGSYSVTEPELSRTVLSRKVEALQRTAPDVVVTGNPGCIMQIGAGLAAAGSSTPVMHPVEILDWSYKRAGFYDH